MVMIVVVAAAVVMFIMVMVMFVFIMAVFVMMFMFIVIMMVPMVVAAAAFFSVLMVMVMMLVLFLLGRFGREGGELGLEGAPLLHRFEDLPARQLVPRGGDQGRLVVVLPDEGDGRLEFCVVHPLGPGEDDGGGVFDLVVVELAEVLHIHLDLGRVGDGGEAAQHRAGGVGRLDRPDDVGELADAEGSMRMRSGWYSSMTWWRAFEKSPTSEQQMQPEFISLIWMPES